MKAQWWAILELCNYKYGGGVSPGKWHAASAFYGTEEKAEAYRNREHENNRRRDVDSDSYTTTYSVLAPLESLTVSEIADAMSGRRNAKAKLEVIA